MCERLHAEPILVLNTSRGLDESLHWLHYCTDNPSTNLGQQRAKNGHPAPYHLHTIEIDNEAWLLMKYPKYLAIVKEFAPALRKEFPSLQLSVCGSYAYDNGPGEGDPTNANWDARILHDAGNLFDILSPHYYNGLLKDNPPDYIEDPRHYEQFLRSRADLIKNSPNPNIKLYISEWNLTHAPWGNDWRHRHSCARRYPQHLRTPIRHRPPLLPRTLPPQNRRHQILEQRPHQLPTKPPGSPPPTTSS